MNSRILRGENSKGEWVPVLPTAEAADRTELRHDNALRVAGSPRVHQAFPHGRDELLVLTDDPASSVDEQLCVA